jgi:hypothetical protein
MGRSLRARFPFAILALLLAAACGDDDDPEGPPPDAGIGSMVLTVAGITISIDSEGNVEGELDTLSFGALPVTAQFLNEAGQPHTAITPDRYSFQIITGDTLGLKFTSAANFTGTLTAAAPGFYSVTFRLIDETNDGTEIQHAATVFIDSGIRTVRLVVGADVVDIAAGTQLPGAIPPIGVGPRPFRTEFLDAAGAPVPIITNEAFSLVVNSSDTNVVKYTEGEGFGGELTGIAPGIASIAVRLRAESNGTYTFVNARTVVVQ